MPESAGLVPKLTLATLSRGCLPYIFPELLPLPQIVIPAFQCKNIRFCKRANCHTFRPLALLLTC